MSKVTFEKVDAKMTKQHFELIAKVLLKNISDKSPQATEVRYPATQVTEAIANQFAYVLEKTNPNFDRKRFLEACGAKDLQR